MFDNFFENLRQKHITRLLGDQPGSEEPQQETLEEVAENYVRNESDATLKLISKYSFKDGAKWQQERMYSEEDVLDILRKSHSIEKESKMDSWITNWFEQFKKK